MRRREEGGEVEERREGRRKEGRRDEERKREDKKGAKEMKTEEWGRKSVKKK